jgi:uncharacterized protein (TIGR02452 family)
MSNTYGADSLWDESSWIQEFNAIKALSDKTERKIGLRRLRSIVYKSTIDIVNNGYYTISNGVMVELPKISNYAYLYNGDARITSNLPSYNTQYGIVSLDSVDAGNQLIALGYNPAVLNMACEDGPGGGVIGGCYGQEESLFRRTDLFKHMYPFSNHAEEYGLKREERQYPLKGSNCGVYVHNAIVFRATEVEGYKLLSHPYTLSFIAVPAIRDPELTETNRLTLRNTLVAKEKIKTILSIALINGHDSIVLGAWGCGIFHNPPQHIASLFKEIIECDEFKNKFKTICFAILEDPIYVSNNSRQSNFSSFYNTFMHDK